jgi:hypothetical protein
MCRCEQQAIPFSIVLHANYSWRLSAKLSTKVAKLPVGGADGAGPELIFHVEIQHLIADLHGPLVIFPRVNAILRGQAQVSADEEAASVWSSEQSKSSPSLEKWPLNRLRDFGRSE